MELSRYIEDELAALMRQVEATPPRRYTSLQRITTLVESAPLAQQQARRITRSIHRIEAAIRAHATPRKKSRQNRPPQHLAEPQFQKSAIKELLDRKTAAGKGRESVGGLERRYREAREQREGLEDHLRELVAKVQRLERVKARREEWQAKERARSAVDRELTKRMQRMKGSRCLILP